MKDGRLVSLLVGEFTLGRLWRSALLIALLLYAWFAFYAWFYSDALIFPAPTASYRDTAETIKLTTADGVRLSAVFLENPQAEQVILYSHGNGEDIGLIRFVLEDLRRLGFSVFAYDYRGYGTSEGKPNEQGLYADIDAAYEYLVKERKVAPEKIIALGRSLGGGAAVDLATRKPLGGLIAESTFASAFRVLTQAPLLPFDKFRNLAKIGRVRCPTLVVYGAKDELIANWHGEKLFAAAPEPKRLLRVESAGHNNVQEIAGQSYNQALQDFAALVKQTKTAGNF
jgi:hypothetical protein